MNSENPVESRVDRSSRTLYHGIACCAAVARGSRDDHIPLVAATLRRHSVLLTSAAAVADEHDHAAATGEQRGTKRWRKQESSAQSHAGHDEATSLALSQQGRKNIGLTLATIELQDFARTVSMPATLVGRPDKPTLPCRLP